jgi:hypothetical protein
MRLIAALVALTLLAVSAPASAQATTPAGAGDPAQPDTRKEKRADKKEDRKENKADRKEDRKENKADRKEDRQERKGN